MIVREHMHETKTFPYGKAAETDPFGEVELIFRKKNITHAPSNVGGGGWVKWCLVPLVLLLVQLKLLSQYVSRGTNKKGQPRKVNNIAGIIKCPPWGKMKFDASILSQRKQ